MFNPYSYQGGTATIDGQPASMNGQSRIPEYIASGVAQNPVGIGYPQSFGYPQTFGYPTTFPGINASTCVNPLTGLPVTPGAYVGIHNTIPTVNPMTGIAGVTGYPNFVNNPYTTTTPWGNGVNYPTIPFGFNNIPATTFGIPAIAPFFGAGLPINPFTGVVPPVAAFNPFVNLGNPFAAPIVNNPWVNPLNTIHNSVTGIPTPAFNPFVGATSTIPNTFGVPGIYGCNPMTAVNPLTAIAAANTGVCGCPTINSTPAVISSLFNRTPGLNPLFNNTAGIGYNPYATIGLGWNQMINNIVSGFGGIANPYAAAMQGLGNLPFGAPNMPLTGLTTPWNVHGTTPWNTAGYINNPWINAITNPWATTGACGANPFTGWTNPAWALASTGTTGYGSNGFVGTVSPFATGLHNTVTCCI